MRAELITSHNDLPALAERWNALALDGSRDGFFRTFSWYRAWMEHIRPDAEPFVIVIRNDRGRIVGLAPLCRLPYRDHGFDLTAVSWAGREVVSGDFLGPVTEVEERSRIVAAILEHLSKVCAQWSLLVMGELVEEGDLDQAVNRMSRGMGYSMHRQEQRICPYIALPGTFDEYLNMLGSSTRYHIRRRMRDVEKRGAVVSSVVTPAELDSGLDTLVRLHLARWNKDGLPGTLGRPGFTDFLRKIFHTLPPGAECRLYRLIHEERAVAALLTFTFGESVLYYQAGWDPESSLASLSPTVVLMAHSIGDAIREGRRHYDFLRGDEAYKSRWTKTCRNTITLLMARTLTAKGYLTACRLKVSVKTLLAGRSQEVPSKNGAGAQVATASVHEVGRGDRQ